MIIPDEIYNAGQQIRAYTKLIQNEIPNFDVDVRERLRHLTGMINDLMEIVIDD